MSDKASSRQQSPIEEIANCLSHALALLLAALALPVLVSRALQDADGGRHALGIGVFLGTMLLLYLASALFHGLPPGRGKQLFEQIDHAAIYLFIAGSYTPFATAALQSGSGWLMLTLVWAMALLGMMSTLSLRITNRFFSTGLYVVFGWLVLVAALPLIEQVSSTARQLLVAGGLAYSVGAVLFLLGSRLRFAHLAWHLMVMAGSGLHLAAAVS